MPPFPLSLNVLRHHPPQSEIGHLPPDAFSVSPPHPSEVGFWGSASSAVPMPHPGSSSLTLCPGLRSRAEGFCSQLEALRAPLQSSRWLGRITAGCSHGRSPSCHRQRLPMGPTHISDATYTREGECDKVSLK